MVPNVSHKHVPARTARSPAPTLRRRASLASQVLVRGTTHQCKTDNLSRRINQLQFRTANNAHHKAACAAMAHSLEATNMQRARSHRPRPAHGMDKPSLTAHLSLPIKLRLSRMASSVSPSSARVRTRNFRERINTRRVLQKCRNSSRTVLLATRTRNASRARATRGRTIRGTIAARSQKSAHNQVAME